MSCEQADLSLSPQSDVESNSQPLQKKSKVTQPTTIELFEIAENGGETVYRIENNEVNVPCGGLLNFAENSYRISYRITNPTDIWYIRVLFMYDENTDDVNEFGPHEMGVWVLRDEREGDDDTVLEGEISNWTGEVTVHSWDFGLYSNDSYQMFDQLSSYGYSLSSNPDPEGKADHYNCFLWIVSDGPVIQEEMDFWVKAQNDPLYAFSVDDVQVWGESSSKNKVKSSATVHVVDDTGNDMEGAIVYGKWSGLAGSIFVDAVTDINGMAYFLNGPELRNNLSGEEIFTVYAIHYPYGAYDPDNNSLWIWPIRPFDSFVMPLP
jgi:hypothetical protein